MQGFAAMWRKEWLELARTHRVTVCVGLFALVGLGSPSLAALTPELLAAIGGDDPGGAGGLGGVEIVLTRAPDATDALLQYHKNFTLTPIVILLLASGTIAHERASGTAELALVRPVARAAFVLAKAASLATLALAGSALAGAGALVYTQVLFGPVDAPGFVGVQALLGLQLLFHVALAVAASAATRGVLAAIGVAMTGYVLVTIAGSLPGLSHYTPGGLGAAALDCIVGVEPVRAASPVIATVVATIALLILAVAVFRRQEV